MVSEYRSRLSSTGSGCIRLGDLSRHYFIVPAAQGRSFPLSSGQNRGNGKSELARQAAMTVIEGLNGSHCPGECIINKE